MRTLKEIDEEIARKSRELAVKMVKTGQNSVLCETDIIAMQTGVRFAEKFNEMHALLQKVEKLLEDGYGASYNPELASQIEAGLKAL